MRSFNWKSATLFTLASTATAVVIQACGHDDGQAIAQSTPAAVSTAAPDPIEGTFQSEVTIKDCTTGATVTSFRGYTAFHQGGTATADNNMLPSTKGVALGAWKRNAIGSYTVNLRFARVLASGAVGQQRFSRSITLAADGNTLTSTLSAQVLDPADNIVQTICGVETGARFQ